MKKLKKKLLNMADAISQRPNRIKDPVKRDHQAGKDCLKVAVLYFLGGNRYQASRYAEMGRYLIRRKW
ncbi:hypothetical protein [uncultured Limosilactobacillus sp.]|uniref:hypothetical protein n=1 Tax=uncultured Limosilactobacillus sp. TaxID=2837629 RepID=UPI0025E48B6C|nr:hypothetical protein [uncultured Limosilactobacillus sp.]